MSHDIHREDRDYPVIDRVGDDEDADRDERIEQDAEVEDHPDRTGDDPEVVEGEVLDEGPSHRSDAPVDTVSGDTDLDDDDLDDDDLDGTDREDTDREDGIATEGYPGDSPEDHHDGAVVPETTAVPLDDVAAQDPAVVVVPPVTDDVDVVPPAGADVAPVVVPVETTGTVTSLPSATRAAGADDESAWRDLQVTFVDDPAAAVRDAADLLEKAVADLRQRYEGSESTEDLRTAFRKYRDVYRGLK